MVTQKHSQELGTQLRQQSKNLLLLSMSGRLGLVPSTA